ncbi:uncharacterized protein Triagg1_6042 [Trichoderma aggressivum f. europaeum]|uniref:DUF7580 domain-containing protein n=1 Tax=Trichoderma aggressivum f. europaeum TaxID=173218 RepID=A0AAE1IFI3_9HYPO|nr:hypothetical protein Triagg1_6042 [Trichoderma aggressivum f. europaeum]
MKEKNETVSDDATAIQLSRANSADLSDETWQDEIRQSLIDLYERTTSACPDAIMLQITSFEGIKSIDENLPPLFNLFLSPCPSKPQQWPQQGQEAFCRVDSDIRLLSHEEEEDGANNLCTTLPTHLDHHHALRIVFDHQDFRYVHEQQDLPFPSANTYVTLRGLLDKHAFPRVDTNNSKHYSLGDRYLLGLNLAKSLFYLFDGPWRPLNWKTENIYFPATQASTSVTVHSRHIPYIAFSLRTGDERENQIQKRKEEAERLCYPMWLALAQILLELHLGRSLAHECVETLDNAERRQQLRRIIDTELRDGEFKSYKEAIEACLSFGFKLLVNPRRERLEEARRGILRPRFDAKPKISEGRRYRCLVSEPGAVVGEHIHHGATLVDNDFDDVKESLKKVKAEDVDEEDEEIEGKDQALDKQELWVIPI